MSRNATAPVRLALGGLIAGALACSTSSGPAPTELQAEITRSQEQISSLQSQLDQRQEDVQARESRISQLEGELQEAKQAPLPAVAAAPPPPSGAAGLLPPAAKPGECYARVFVPAEYAVETETVTAREATERIEVIPARYEWVEEKILVREASTRLEEVPAQYEWVEEQVLERAAHTIWKKGRGPIERVDHATGEIMCLVEVPDKYRTVRKRVQKAPAGTREVQIPAKYETVRVRKLVSPPQEKRIAIPAEFQTVEQRKLVRDGELAWRPILCETNMTSGLVIELQRALERQGHTPGPIDGVIGQQTLTALRSFQQAKGLPTGNLTLATLNALGINLPR